MPLPLDELLAQALATGDDSTCGHDSLSGVSIGDGASEWNRQNAGRTSLDAGG
jgi:hypothetical protein